MMELITGGSGSGKSAFAEKRICRLHRRLCNERKKETPLYYIADMVPHGRETEARIARHRKMRAGKGFTTLEWYVDIPGKLAEASSQLTDLSDACILLECVSNLTANEMYEPGGAGVRTVERIVSGIQLLKTKCAHLVLVTNDVFRESVPDSAEMSVYKKNLGKINVLLSEMADCVTEVVFGIPVCVKDKTGCRAACSGDNKMKLQGQRGEQGMEEKTGMIFITGGACQGKSEFAADRYGIKEWLDGADCRFEEIRCCKGIKGINHFHLFIRRWFQDGKTQQELMELLINRSKQAETFIIVCDEIGCGLVPIDAFEREYRDAAGRICTELVKNADQVYRVTCGIPARLK